MLALDEVAAVDLCWSISILAAAVFIGVILEYCVHTIHRKRHPHPNRIGDWIVREIHAWRRHHQRHHRPR